MDTFKDCNIIWWSLYDIYNLTLSICINVDHHYVDVPTANICQINVHDFVETAEGHWLIANRDIQLRFFVSENIEIVTVNLVIFLILIGNNSVGWIVSSLIVLVKLPQREPESIKDSPKTHGAMAPGKYKSY